MNIIQSWKDSLGILRPKNLKTFLLVTAKTVMDVYRSINKPLASRGNWIVAGILVLLIGLTNVIKMFHLVSIEELLLNGILHFLFFMFLLGMRPSVAIKDEAYFASFIKERWYLLALTMLLGMQSTYLLAIYYIPLTFILYMLFLLFALDSKGSMGELLVAIKNSVKMLIFNLPLFCVLWLALSVITVVMNFFVAFALGYFGGLTFATILYILFVPIEVALITNLYIKLLHSQPSLYFKQPE